MSCNSDKGEGSRPMAPTTDGAAINRAATTAPRNLSALGRAMADELDVAFRNLQDMLQRIQMRGYTDHSAMNHADTHLVEANMWAKRAICDL